jgi:DNA invertase Pin-like site-specific DNA recombinase
MAKTKTKTRPPATNDGRPKLIGLIRVSTDKQEESGLGLDAQLAAIDNFRAMIGGNLLRTYKEIESGMHDDVDRRPQFKAAVADALHSNARLVIGKLDRLMRSIPVLAYLKKSWVQFTACDLPNANELTFDIMVAVRAEEGRAISQRTKDALKAYRDNRRVSKRIRALHPNGIPPEIVEATAGKLGASLPQCRNLTDEARRKGTKVAGTTRTVKARTAYDHLVPLMSQLRADGLTFQVIADRLNDLGQLTRQACPWNKGQLKRVLDRVRQA